MAVKVKVSRGGGGRSDGGLSGTGVVVTDDNPTIAEGPASDTLSSFVLAANPVLQGITAVAGVVSGAIGAYEMNEAAGEARDAGQAAADAAAAFTAEQVRVLEEENERKNSLARATAAASGVSGASSEIYMASLEEAGRSDIDWMKQVGKSTYSAAISSGESAYHQARSAMWGNIGSAVGSAGKLLDLS